MSRFNGRVAGTGSGTLKQTQSSFTAVGGEMNIPIGNSVDVSKQTLEVYMDNIRLFASSGWTLNSNKTSIDLVGFTANAGSVFTFLINSI
jgi:hypothetical protein